MFSWKPLVTWYYMRRFLKSSYCFRYFTKTRSNANGSKFTLMTITSSELPNKRADQNKRVWRDFLFIYYIVHIWKKIPPYTTWKMRVCLKFFSFVKWKIESVVEFFSKKAVKRACLFIREFRVYVYHEFWWITTC